MLVFNDRKDEETQDTCYESTHSFPIHPFSTPLKTSENLTVFWCFLMFSGGRERKDAMGANGLTKINWCYFITFHCANIYIYYLYIMVVSITYYTRAVPRASFIQIDQYGRLKKCPQKQKVKLLTLPCVIVKRKFNETHKFQN